MGTGGMRRRSSAVASSTPAGKDAAGQLSADGLQRTYRFEVHAAGSEPEQLIDYNGHDQHDEQLYGGEDLLQQQHGANIQQYVYDEVGGGALLCYSSCKDACWFCQAYDLALLG